MGVGRNLSIVCQWTTELIHNVTVKMPQRIHVYKYLCVVLIVLQM